MIMRNNIENLPQGCSMVIEIDPRHELVTISARKNEVCRTVYSNSLPSNMSARINTQYDQEKIVVQLFAIQNALIVEVAFVYMTGQVTVCQYGYEFLKKTINLT